MIRVDIDETFPISATTVDGSTGEIIPEQEVYYEVYDADDNILSTRVSGILEESAEHSGIYTAEISLDTDGSYRWYATSSGINVGSEDIIVNPENIYDLVKQNRQYNISVEEVLRTNSTSTPSQDVRKVAVGDTDYIINRLKWDSEESWDEGTIVEGNVYAWYRNITDSVPYKMGNE